MTTSSRIAAVLALLPLALVAWFVATLRVPLEDAWPARIDDRAFWAMTRGFSEPDGAFIANGGYRSDNLVSNERSLQTVLPTLRMHRRSGAFIGVGPEQNFTLIVALEPVIAFVVDIRRENQLLHLLYKALAEESIDRADFLSRLFARQRPTGLHRSASVDTLFDAIEASPRSAALARATFDALVARLRDVHGFPLSADDIKSLSVVYEKFCDGGPTMGWDVGGPWIPSYAELMAETDSQGVPGSYLASDEAFAVFRRYQRRNRIVPVVGDFAGDKALRSIARYLTDRKTVVSAFYTSNVEGYLRRAGFVANVASFPADETSTIVRTRLTQTGETNGRPDFHTSVFLEPIRHYVSRWSLSP